MVIVRPKMRLFGEKFVNLRTIFGSMRARKAQWTCKHKKMKVIKSIKNLVLMAVASLLLTSCLKGNDSETVLTDYYNNIVTAFSLVDNDNVAKGLSKYSFTVDNYGTSDAAIHAKFPNDGIIFNADSLPFGTIADSVKVTISFSSPDSAYFTLYSLDGVMRQYSNVAYDSALYFASCPDARLHISARGNHKTYHVKVNVHKVAGDTIKWHPVTEQLWKDIAISDQRTDTIGSTLFWYVEDGTHNQVSTADMRGYAKTWTEPASVNVAGGELLDLQTLYNWHDALFAVGKTSGALLTSKDGYNWEVANDNYKFTSILGNQLKTRDVYGTWNSDTLNAIIHIDGAYHFAVSADAKEWRIDNVLPHNFPISGFTRPISVAARANNGNLTSRLYVIGGKMADGSLTSSTWSCDGWSEIEKGSNWAEFPQPTLTPTQNGTVIEYTLDRDRPKTFWLFYPGTDENGKIGQTQHYGRSYANLYYSEDSGVSWHQLFTKYPKLADNSAFADMAPNSGFCNPANFEIYYFGGKRADGSFSTQVWGGMLPELTFIKRR